MGLEVVAGTSVEQKSRQDDVIGLLEDTIALIKSGHISADTALVVIADLSDIDQASFMVEYVNRAMQNLSLIELAKAKLLQHMEVL